MDNVFSLFESQLTACFDHSKLYKDHIFSVLKQVLLKTVILLKQTLSFLPTVRNSPHFIKQKAVFCVIVVCLVFLYIVWRK